MLRSLGLLVVALYSAPAWGSQIVAMDVAPAGGVRASLAQAVTPVVHSELSRVAGISVITQSDIQALVALDASKAALDCNAEHCMAGVAGALGAELLLTSRLSKVGSSYHVSLTLIEVEGAKVLRRVTGKARGNEDATGEAVQEAVRELFAGDLPPQAKGPGSLSQRAYQAALAGLRASLLNKSKDALASRKRVVLDLVRTELDFDAAPKIQTLSYETARGIADFEGRIALAKNSTEVRHLVTCIAVYQEVAKDLQRVKEIRERSRARGVVPSARPLRFEQPEVPERVRTSKSKAFERAYGKASKRLSRALSAWKRKDRKGFASHWTTERRQIAVRRFDDARGREADRSIRWSLLPLHAMTPRTYKRLVDQFTASQKVTVLRASTIKGAFHQTDSVYMVKQSGSWRVSDW